MKLICAMHGLWDQTEATKSAGGLTAPTKPTALVFKITTKRGDVKLPAIKVRDQETVIRELKSVSGGAGAVVSRTALFTEAIVNLVQQYPNELKAEPRGKDSAAKKVMDEFEASIFGKGQPTDPVYKVIKSEYLGLYREGTPLFVEKDGEKWAKPLKKVRSERKPTESALKSPDEKFIERIEDAVAAGLKYETVLGAMALLGAYKDAWDQARAAGVESPEKLGTEDAGEEIILG